MKYTGDDVRNALLARDTDEGAKVEECSARAYLIMMCDSAFIGEEMYQDYLKGTETLKAAKIVTTNDRYDITNGVAYDMAANKLIERGVDSPVVEVMNGYAGTNQMCVVYALKEKQ